MNPYYKEKIGEIVNLSYNFGYEDCDREFWEQQPVEVIGFVSDLISFYKERFK